MKKLLLASYYALLLCFLLAMPCLALLPWSQNHQFRSHPSNYEGSSDFINLEYHMGPVLASSPINLYIIWYGHWYPKPQQTIRDFLHSLSDPSLPSPSVAEWWRTVRLYTDQTGSNITGNFIVSGEFHDLRYSHGRFLTRLDMQSVIKSNALPLNVRNGLYLVLTSPDVQVQDFCRAVCGFHYFTFPTIVGVTVPYAWVGLSTVQCPGMCAYPFAFWPDHSGRGRGRAEELIRPPNGDPGVDGMISVLAHELAEVSSNPLVNAWYAGGDPTAPTEIADLCMGVYGSGGGGGYTGKVMKDSWGNGYNLNGVKGRKFLVQWVWDPAKRRCWGPNAMD